MTFSAQEVLKQLGGNKFIVMTGAKNFSKDKNSIMFRIPKARLGINYIKIKLNSMDTYDMEFGKIRKFEYKVVKKVNGVYNDQLHEIFTRTTGLNTRLF